VNEFNSNLIIIDRYRNPGFKAATGKIVIFLLAW